MNLDQKTNQNLFVYFLFKTLFLSSIEINFVTNKTVTIVLNIKDIKILNFFLLFLAFKKE